jgi:hypothetical protein
MVWAVFGCSMFAYGSRRRRRCASFICDGTPVLQPKLFVPNGVPVIRPKSRRTSIKLRIFGFAQAGGCDDLGLIQEPIERFRAAERPASSPSLGNASTWPLIRWRCWAK